MSEALRDAEELAGEIGLLDACRFAAEQLDARGELETLSRERLVTPWPYFARYVERAFGIRTVGSVTATAAEAWIRSLTRTGRPPSTSTMHARRASLRLFYRTLRELRLATHEPSLDLVLPSRPPKTLRALTDLELAACRFVAVASILADRYPPIVALAEAGASTGEIGWLRHVDCDLRGGTVELPGGRKEYPRRVALTDWGVSVLRDAAARAESSDEWIAVDHGSSYDIRRTSVTSVLSEVLQRAGVRGPGVEPRSFAAWAGARAFATTGRLECVATVIGLRSLDLAAAMIGYEWRVGVTE